jgi:hypothetical protein
MPLPRDELTPPVTKRYLAMEGFAARARLPSLRGVKIGFPR